MSLSNVKINQVCYDTYWEEGAPWLNTFTLKGPGVTYNIGSRTAGTCVSIGGPITGVTVVKGYFSIYGITFDYYDVSCSDCSVTSVPAVGSQSVVLGTND